MQRGQQLEARVEDLGTLEVHDGADRAAEVEVLRRAHDAQRPVRLERSGFPIPASVVASACAGDRRLRLHVGPALRVVGEAVGMRA